ncbi:MAG TPA: DUF6252 family protein [Chitinophagaceae bacterium]|nr:DUF6252 family protein [Chitinophagaceae bacterium]
MKKMHFILSVSIILISLVACNGGAHSEAVKQAALIEKTMKENTPGSLPTSEAGYYMKAKINGADWSASHMMPDDAATSSYKTIQGESPGRSIYFQLWKRGIEPGKKIPFSDNRAATLSVNDSEFFHGSQGEVEITKMDDQWMEGNFHFTGTTNSSDERVEVTDGSFRVALIAGLK